VESSVLARRARAAPAAATEQFLLCSVGGVTYGIGVESLWEVLPPDGMTALPTPTHQPCTALAYRGHRLPLVRLAVLFGAPADGVPASARVLLLDARGRTLGILVDQVQEVAEVAGAAIAPMPALATLLDSRIFRGVCRGPQGIVILLRAEGLGDLPDVVRFQGQGQRSVAS
jgi:purine-binding chemotaxis protein CheW